MSRIIRKLLVTLACSALLIMGLHVRNTLAAAQPRQSAASSAEGDQADLQWSYGKITMPPHKVGKGRIMLSIDEVKYTLGSNIVIIEQVEERPGSVINRAAGPAALAYGKKISFAVTEEGQPVIVKIVVDSVPTRS